MSAPISVTLPVTIPYGAPISVMIQPPMPLAVTLVTGGLRGLTGPQGVVGPAGPVGGNAVYQFAVPAVASYTIIHGLGRYPAAAVFYDSSGNQCEVGIQNMDTNTIDVLQDDPTSGVLVLV